jgi:poly(3-hydroxybutyrate) depolymerase
MRSLALAMWAAPCVPTLLRAATPPATGSQHIEYSFAPTGENMPLRYYVPTNWDGQSVLPIMLMLHGAGANENSYMDMREGQLMQLAEQHGYIVVSPLGHTPLGAYGNPLRLPAVFGQDDVAAEQVSAITDERRRTLALSELEVVTALELITEMYGADRQRTFLAGHSMGSGGVWHLAARYPERWRAIAPMSGPFVNRTSYPFERIKPLPIFMTEGLGATPSLEGSRAMAAYLREQSFNFEYLEVDGDHGGMVPQVWPAIFDYFNSHKGSADPL